MKSQTDRHLPVSDEHDRGLFQHMREGFAYCRMIFEAGEPSDFIYLEVNPAFEELTGLTGVRGRFVSEVIPGVRELNPELFAIYGRVARTGTPEKLETYLESLRKWLAISVYSPKPEHFVAVFDDITARKRTEARVADVLLFNEKILATAPVGIIIYKATGECVFANENAAHIVGTTIEILTAQNFRTLESWKKSGLLQLADEAIASEEPVMADIHHTTTFGQDKWLTASAVTFKSKAETQLLLTFLDITERKQAEEALRRSEAMLLQTGAMAKVGGWELDLQTMKLSWSLETYRIHEVDPSLQLDLESAMNHFLPEAHPTFRDAVQRAIQEGLPYDLELQLVTARGRRRWIRTIGEAEFQNGKSRRLYGTIQDITERKQAEEDQRRLLEDTEKRVKQLTILHEVAVLATQVDTVDRLIEAATEIIGKNLFPDNFGVLLMEEESGILHVHPSYRFVSAEGLTARDVPLGIGITGQVAQTGRPLRIGDITKLENYIHVDPRTRSELCVPIRIRDHVLGVINAESTRTEAFSEDDELLLGTLAGQLATAIEQIRAAQAERQWLDQLAHSNDLIYALAQIMTHIEKALTPDEIIRTLGRELNRIDLTCIMAIYDRELSSFTINYTSLEPKVLEQMEYAIGFPLIKHTFSLRKLALILDQKDVRHPVLITNGEQEMQVLFPHPREQGVSEILAGIGAGPEAEGLRLPLVFEENLLGILWVWGKGITRADLPIMSILTKQIGSSLERARLYQEVQSLALTDPLTGLHNRRSLFELGRIEFARAKRAQSPISCLLLDLDHFKQVNDTYGHLTGDEVLREFAERCKRSVREVDLVGRYGGEEFVIFLPETNLDASVQVAERLRTSMENSPIKVSGVELKITVSIGVATKDENTPNLQTLLARADQAMYVAKFKGRNRVAISR